MDALCSVGIAVGGWIANHTLVPYPITSAAVLWIANGAIITLAAGRARQIVMGKSQRKVA